MQTQLTEIREQQREIWNKFSLGWKKWDDFTMNFLKPMGDVIVEELQIKQNDQVLDVACGTGEPGLTLAGIATEGKVIGTDLAEGMLTTARDKADRRKIFNYETKVCDVCELPFGDNVFNKVSCRMGFMFFPDMQLACDEMFRVLKPGGKMCTSVWGVPAKNLWITNVLGVVSKIMQLQPPPPGAPGMFRCANPGFIKTLMEESGFKNVHEQEVNGKLVYKDFEEMWQMMNEVVAPVVVALSKADPATIEEIKATVEQQSQQYKTQRGLELDYSSLIIGGEK